MWNYVLGNFHVSYYLFWKLKVFPIYAELVLHMEVTSPKTLVVYTYSIPLWEFSFNCTLFLNSLTALHFQTKMSAKEAESIQ